MRILVVEDDPVIVEVVRSAFTQAGYQVKSARDADAAFALLRREGFDLAVLDIGLPGISGLNLLQILRQETPTANLPVIILTSHTREVDKLAGFQKGADDYLVKPFAARELVARVKAILKRSQGSGRVQAVLEVGGVRLETDRREVTTDGQRVVLKPVEFDLLALLMNRPGQIFTYAALADGLKREVTSESLYVHVNALRKKLGSKGKLIETVYAVGYKFAP